MTYSPTARRARREVGAAREGALEVEVPRELGEGALHVVDAQRLLEDRLAT